MADEKEDKPQPKPEPEIRPDRGTRERGDEGSETRRGPVGPDPHTKRGKDD